MIAKICGISTPETALAAAEAGASHLGFNFYPPSPRSVSPEAARAMADLLPTNVKTVALVVDPDDALLEEIVSVLDPDLIQCHGGESPERIAEIRARFGRPLIKAIRVASTEDVEAAHGYDGAADIILFDAKAPKGMKGALPGGNGLTFDWRMLEAWHGSTPWWLSGGLEQDNVVEAIRRTRPVGVDTASGVEDSPGVKSLMKIDGFLAAARDGFSTSGP